MAAARCSNPSRASSASVPRASSKSSNPADARRSRGVPAARWSTRLQSGRERPRPHADRRTVDDGIGELGRDERGRDPPGRRPPGTGRGGTTAPHGTCRPHSAGAFSRPASASSTRPRPVARAGRTDPVERGVGERRLRQQASVVETPGDPPTRERRRASASTAVPNRRANRHSLIRSRACSRDGDSVPVRRRPGDATHAVPPRAAATIVVARNREPAPHGRTGRPAPARARPHRRPPAGSAGTARGSRRTVRPRRVASHPLAGAVERVQRVGPVARRTARGHQRAQCALPQRQQAMRIGGRATAPPYRPSAVRAAETSSSERASLSRLRSVSIPQPGVLHRRQQRRREGRLPAPSVPERSARVPGLESRDRQVEGEVGLLEIDLGAGW